MKIDLHRAALSAAATALTLGAVLAPTAARAASSPEADAASTWLASQLTDGVVHNQQYDFDDYGLTADIGLALAALGTQQGALSDVLDAVADDPTAYAGGTGSRYAGATAKLATLVQQGGRDATSFGGHDLVAELETVVVDDGDEAGRGVDDGTDYSNTIGQTFVVRALAGAGSDELDAAVGYLLKQQCSSGEFRINMFTSGSVGRECGGSGDSLSVDATALAVQALLEAGDAGAPGADAAVADAKDWLVSNQASDGSFSDDGTANSNSTGLAAAALAAVGESAAATKAADWMVPLQATASTKGLGDEAGAIAFDPAALAAGKTDGITVETRDQWTRATAQAAVGISHASAAEPEPEPGPVASIDLSLSDASPTQGDTITITATGEDADGRSTGDVSDELTLTSSVDSDRIEGNTVTFDHASPHTITATHVPTGTTASVLIEVAPAAADDPGTDTGTSAGSGAAPASARTLPDAGSEVDLWQLYAAVAMVVVGAGLVAGGRRRVVAPTHARR